MMTMGGTAHHVSKQTILDKREKCVVISMSKKVKSAAVTDVKLEVNTLQAMLTATFTVETGGQFRRGVNYNTLTEVFVKLCQMITDAVDDGFVVSGWYSHIIDSSIFVVTLHNEK